MLSDQKDLLAVFNAHGVRYLIVGAHAVGVHSEPRGTKDLDVLIEASSANAKNVFAALLNSAHRLGERPLPISTTSPAASSRSEFRQAESEFCSESKASTSSRRGPTGSIPHSLRICEYM